MLKRGMYLAFASVLAYLCAGARPLHARVQASAPTAAPVTRKVKNQVLTSDEAPRVRIKFDKAFKYAGAQSFVLYDVAQAEQHFFVDADKEGRIRRLYWVQFEGYLPNNQHTYDYKSTNVINLGGLDFFADARAMHVPAPGPDAAARPANKISDGERAQSFLASKGYKLASKEALWQRFVHLLDASKRSELLIIYLEDLGALGLTAADLSKEGRAAERWDSVSKALLERARKGLEISRR